VRDFAYDYPTLRKASRLHDLVHAPAVVLFRFDPATSSPHPTRLALRTTARLSLVSFMVAFVATQSETVHAIDYDFGSTLWKYHVNYTASLPPITDEAQTNSRFLRSLAVRAENLAAEINKEWPGAATVTDHGWLFSQFSNVGCITETARSWHNNNKLVVLIGHSFGGMVVNLILQENNSILANNMTRAVTVASPFYGYDGQIHRWFEGEPLLNHIGPFDVTKQVIEVITSLPGVYALLYLDAETFQTNRAALCNDPEFPLNGYPSNDFANATLQVDPFSPGSNRYPQNIGLSTSELQRALQSYRKIALGPPALYVDRFFNIRGIPKNTNGSISWGLLTGPNNPNTSPIGNGSGVPGDGTLPHTPTRDEPFPRAGDYDSAARGAID
jgi:hypothetical protein